MRREAWWREAWWWGLEERGGEMWGGLGGVSTETSRPPGPSHRVS